MLDRQWDICLIRPKAVRKTPAGHLQLVFQEVSEHPKRWREVSVLNVYHQLRVSEKTLIQKWRCFKPWATWYIHIDRSLATGFFLMPQLHHDFQTSTSIMLPGTQNVQTSTLNTVNGKYSMTFICKHGIDIEIWFKYSTHLYYSTAKCFKRNFHPYCTSGCHIRRMSTSNTGHPPLLHDAEFRLHNAESDICLSLQCHLVTMGECHKSDWENMQATMYSLEAPPLNNSAM